ncbi:amidohydrolase family protein [Mitsuaria sp. GD03876]|uniref:amidohydrolase family protein n=1 Tax=Mitsuaria sp. GD03876 TaxID=2975399 RepID=UPI002447A2AF|nr:amidohydrolase family protein [Mitsuaria sp. GD03876]MDH0863322.1 amidohydrolase [Mitsuaria sp. GD03876]
MTRTPVRAALPALLAAALAAAALTAPIAAKAEKAGEARYTMADFAKVPKIDAHVHLHNADPAFLDAARKLGFKVLTINVDYPDFPPLDEQQQVAIALRKARPADVAWAVSFSSETSDQPGWLDATRRRVDAGLQAGAIGVKVWKNIGMSLRDKQGKLVMIDDARFAPLFSYFEQQGIPLLGHQGEPHNCWLPLEKMTVLNDREYFAHHPQYHMALHPEMPSWEEQMAARDRMVAAHPKLKFIGMHMASLERDVDELAAFLDRFPLAKVDLAARIGQLQAQSQHDREKVRRFLIQYQDRLLYGTDVSQPPQQSGAELLKEVEPVWRMHWRYFNTEETFKVSDLEKPVQGLGLPRAVVDKLYHLNAERSFPTAWKAAR